jgi:poly-gamma-glutamate capsule biosynthesis protein CapA/YwtB (metallophosphatase superfamily)
VLRIGLLGDVMLGRKVGEALLRGNDPAELWHPELRALTSSLDLVICNLECCLSARGAPTTRIEGKPFFFRGPPQAVAALEAVNAGVVGLANNHLLDYGEQAGADTVELLAAHGISTAGAGLDVAAARAPALIERAGVRIGVLALSDHPVEYAAAANHPGIAYAPLRTGAPAWLLDAVAALRERCDLTVVFLHWGPNMATRPSAWQRALGSALIAAGADLVAGHSAHVFHGIAWEQDRPVLYDLGDALDDYRTDPLLRNDLGVLAIHTRGDHGQTLELVGLALDYCATRLAVGGEADWIAARLQSACGDLGSEVERTEANRFTIRPARSSHRHPDG